MAKQIKPVSRQPHDHGMANGPGMRVVVYLRKSNKTKSKSRDETISIQQQRTDLRKWCLSRGWVIVREYVDDGKSASKNEGKRKDFARMLTDLEADDSVRAVVVWDLSRLTRKDSVDAGKAAGALKANGVIVESYRDGEIDLRTTIGRTLWNMHTEMNSDFALKISGGVIRGRADSLERGNWPHGQIPYGYKRQYWDGGKMIAEYKRNQQAGKARHWTTKIEPDPEEAKFAKQIIRDYATRDVSVRGLSTEMQKIGAPTLTGKIWKPQHVKTIIRCPAYVGDIAIGYSDGWKRSVEGSGYEAHGHSEPQVNRDSCTPIIDRATWERANQKLDKLRDGHRVHTGKSSPLSGVVYCGHCGQSMAKSTRKGVTRFTCSTANRNPNNPTCKQWAVHESDILPIMTTKLIEAVDFQLLNDLQGKPSEVATDQLDTLKGKEAELVKQVSKAAKNLALCDADVYDDVQQVLTELKTELDRIRNTVKLLEAAGDKQQQKQIGDWWKSNRDRVQFLKLPPAKAEEAFKAWGVKDDGRLVDRKAVIPASTDTFRELLKRLNARITLHFTRKTMGKDSKRQYYAVEWGRVTANLDVQSLDGTGPEEGRGRILKRCGSGSRAHGRSSRIASGTERPTLGWIANNSRPTASCPNLVY